MSKSVDEALRATLTGGQIGAAILVSVGLFFHPPSLVWGLIVALATPLVALLIVALARTATGRQRIYAALTVVTLALALYLVR